MAAKYAAKSRFFAAYLAAITALSLGVQIYAFGAFVGIARKNSGSVRLVGAFIVAIPAMIALAIGAHNLPRPIVTAAERERLVSEQYAETYSNTDAHITQDVRDQLLQSVRENFARRGGPPSYPYVTWVLAGVLTAAGLATFLHGRRRWLELDLG